MDWSAIIHHASDFAVLAAVLGVAVGWGTLKAGVKALEDRVKNLEANGAPSLAARTATLEARVAGLEKTSDTLKAADHEASGDDRDVLQRIADHQRFCQDKTGYMPLNASGSHRVPTNGGCR